MGIKVADVKLSPKERVQLVLSAMNTWDLGRIKEQIGPLAEERSDAGRYARYTIHIINDILKFRDKAK